MRQRGAVLGVVVPLLAGVTAGLVVLWTAALLATSGWPW